MIPPHIQPVVDRAIRKLAVLTPAAPLAICQAPGRVNLIGEHTDYSDGFVMPMAIDRACVALAAPSSDALTRIAFADHRDVVELDPLEKQEPNLQADRGSPRGYVRGVIRAFQDLVQDCGPLPPLTIAIASSVPLGGGLSSSASLEIALASLLAAITQATLDTSQLATIGRFAEHEFAGVPCGIMDQFVSAGARQGHAMLLDCRSSLPRHVPMPANAVIAIIDTGVRHSLAAGEYAIRRRWCEHAARELGVATLREATDDGGLERIERSSLAGDLRAAARHVVSENLRTLAAADALRKGDAEALGRLMNDSHASLRDNFRVSCAELDAAVEIAQHVDGVHGARMTGGGFGGSVVALCDPRAASYLAQALDARYHARTGRTHTMFVTPACGGASRLA
jgi:galactokinase